MCLPTLTTLDTLSRREVAPQQFGMMMWLVQRKQLFQILLVYQIALEMGFLLGHIWKRISINTTVGH